MITPPSLNQISKVVYLDKQNIVLQILNDVTVGTLKVENIDKITGEVPLYNNSYVNVEMSENVETNVRLYFIKINEVDYSVIKYDGINDPINEPQIGFTYDQVRNAFIPPCPNEEYVLNENTFEWEPDPEKLYDLHGDGKYYRYDSENLCWHPTW